MSNQDSNSSPLEDVNERKDQEQLSQQALGNAETEPTEDLATDNDLLSTPVTTGTGSNPAAATPNSLIVHEDEDGENRYEEGETNTDTDKE
ncbi:hypothetical protein GJU39_18710 [Pedobacter petrophilus]|uniref:Uncharacterized protein n=1 Tax=Pedobacter petrophilus TaxID=1908241 RepID=A0A7K0G3Z3_9SPHI|nr:hypothetical protein [Pedobacter petrophilus]MRX78114.1 hypothetical protein [Pedobacter petrophilus]